MQKNPQLQGISAAGTLQSQRNRWANGITQYRQLPTFQYSIYFLSTFYPFLLLHSTIAMVEDEILRGEQEAHKYIILVNCHQHLQLIIQICSPPTPKLQCIEA